MNVCLLSASQASYSVFLETNDYVIGKGACSTVYLSSEKKVVIKKYAYDDERVIELSRQSGKSSESFVKERVQRQLEISQRTDHPSIIKVREVYFEPFAACVVMDYVESHSENNSRIQLMQQFLSAVEHLLLRNIYNFKNPIITSHGAKLMLAGSDESGNLIERIESVLESLGGVKHSLPESTVHLRELINWIEAMQNELSTSLNLSNTICENSPSQILQAHTQLQSGHPNHVSFNSAQHSKFLSYSLVAANLLKKFSPGKYPDSYLQQMHLIRYPVDHMPKSLNELFQMLPIREDYDTASSLVADVLISASPSLKEKESEESAWGIFENNERKGDVENYIYKCFELEKVSPRHFRERIKALVKETPKSKQGVIYNYFLPKEAPLNKALYVSHAYGIPVDEPVLDFYNRYDRGLIEENDSQLRFLPSALSFENGFDLTKVKSYRLTTIPSEQLDIFAKRIEKVVEEIFKDHLEEMLQLAESAAKLEMIDNPTERQKGYRELLIRHLVRRDISLALYYWHKLEGQERFSYLHGIIACLINKNQLVQAEQIFEEFHQNLIYKDQLLARFALAYFDRANKSKLDWMINRIVDENIKKFVLYIVGSRYPEYEQDKMPNVLDCLMSDDDLINL